MQPMADRPCDVGASHGSNDRLHSTEDCRSWPPSTGRFSNDRRTGASASPLLTYDKLRPMKVRAAYPSALDVSGIMVLFRHDLGMTIGALVGSVRHRGGKNGRE